MSTQVGIWTTLLQGIPRALPDDLDFGSFDRYGLLINLTQRTSFRVRSNAGTEMWTCQLEANRDERFTCLSRLEHKSSCGIMILRIEGWLAVIGFRPFGALGAAKISATPVHTFLLSVGQNEFSRE